MTCWVLVYILLFGNAGVPVMASVCTSSDISKHTFAGVFARFLCGSGP